MSVGDVEENVTVTGASPVVDSVSTKITTTFDAATLASVPSGIRDYWSVLSETPALKLTRVDVGGSSSGSQSNCYSYVDSEGRLYGLSSRPASSADLLTRSLPVWCGR